MEKKNNITADEVMIVALIACGNCDNYQHIEEYFDKKTSAEVFYEGGWRKVKEKVYCPDCSANLKIE